MKKRLITSALPYVNNVPHLGNLIQVLSADVFARFCRSYGYETLYVCGTDEYGTASETKALQEGVSPRELCDKYHKIHEDIYSWFEINFDAFGRTSTPKQTEIVQSIFKEVDKNGYISEKESEQLYCPKCSRFLADRYVTGTCPHCGYEEARGDQCDKCGTLLDPVDLINPKCSVCGTTPVLKKTKNLYINLPKALPLLEKWIDSASSSGFWAKNAIQITQSWIRDGLQERCITRDLKWGIPVPKPGYEDKVFYVWFDAPIGYISITASFFDNYEYWWKDPENTELFQFIGKDNIPFHTVIFPSTLLATGDKWTMLHHMSSTEYLNYEGGKFSKSLGVGIFGNDVEDIALPPDVWRFYIFYNRPEKGDFTFTWKDFQDKVNKELIGNLSNLVNRTLTFIKKFFSSTLTYSGFDEELIIEIKESEERITSLLDRAEEKDALREIFSLSDLGNRAFQAFEPWKKKDVDRSECERFLYTLSLLVKDLGILITPYMPKTGEKIISFFNKKDQNWKDLGKIDKTISIGEVELLFNKIEDKDVNMWREKYNGKQSSNEEKKVGESSINTENNKENTMLDNGKTLLENWSEKVILKVSKIIKCVKHPEGDKLYILTLDTGEEEERTIVSSIVPFYSINELLGHNIVLVSNLKPANFRGVKSNGMLLAASDKNDTTHSTCEVIFADDFEVGTVLKYEGQGDTEKVTTYLKSEHFFALPMHTVSGVVTIDGRPIGDGNKWLRVNKYINGNVG